MLVIRDDVAFRQNVSDRPALLHWSQVRIRAVAAEERPVATATCATNVTTTEREADALVRREGYTDVRRLTDMLLERHSSNRKSGWRRS